MFVIIVKFSKQRRRLLLDHLLAVADNNALVVLAYSLSRKRVHDTVSLHAILLDSLNTSE